MTYAPTLSVLLPTVRQHLVKHAVDSIGPAAGRLSYEVIVVADFPATLDGPCRWIRRERNGVVDAVNVACAAARGKYWFLFNDESILDPLALEVLYAEALAHPDHLLTPQHVPAYPFVYYGLPFAPFPFAHQDVFARLGGMFDPAFKAFYADPDLSMRAHTTGVPVREVEAAVLHHANTHDDVHHASVAKYLEADRAEFRKRWDRLGVFCDP